MLIAPFFSMLCGSSRKLRLRLAMAGALLLAINPTAGLAVITANFTDGNGTTLPDQWTGVAGAGWAGAWSAVGSDTGTGVTNTSPLAGGGNYLHFVDNTTTQSVLARRQYQTAGEVDITKPYSISLNFRYDGLGSEFTTFADRIAIFGDTSGIVTGTNATNTWCIGVAASNSGAGGGQSVFAGNWYFIDNNGSNAFATGNMVDTGLAFVAGREYAIIVDIDPTTGTYSASIDDGVNDPFSASDMTFRRGAGAVNTNWLYVSTISTTASESIPFSVDNISIVPEPSVSVLFLAGLGGLVMRRRR